MEFLKVAFLTRRFLCYRMRMRESDAATKQPRVSVALPFHYGWVIIGLSFLTNLTAAGIRSAPSVLIHPLEAEFGWSRTAIASAASLNLLLYGLAAPLGGWLIDRVGPRRVVLGSLAAIAVGVTGTVLVQELWQLIVLWGIVLGIATGLTPSLGPSVASRWFIGRRGLALGVLINANAAGQVIFLPLLMAVIVSRGWRNALMIIVGAAVILIPAILLWMRDAPADVGLEPYGSGTASVSRERRSPYANRGFQPISASSLSEVFRTANFWLLSACFFVCGVTANGLIGTHLIPHAIERGIPQVTAAAAVGLMGGASFIGTTLAGWLVDRVDARKVLSLAYALRGSSLFILPYVSEPWGLFVFAVLYGLDWFATGPATTAILAQNYGHERVGTLFGLVFVFHQLGGALAAVGGGWVHMQFGDYQYAFLAGAVMGLMAACMALMIRATGRAAPAIPAITGLAKA
ncbi:MAG: MFS transporter [Deltaproteobacteria bacterium]|nr:MFS transporter [Deltaproteobacteria bacterium]